MGRLMQQFTEPFSSISDRPLHFLVWSFVSIIFGLAGFWLPVLLALTGGGAASQTFRSLVYAGTLSSFSIVLLADGIASALIVVNAGSNITAAGMRAFVGCGAVLLVVVEVGVLVFAYSNGGSTHTSVTFQLFLAAAAIALASYLYCFRSPSWETDVADVKEKEDKEVAGLSLSAEEKATDEGGTKL
jgi:hypothetical protein